MGELISMPVRRNLIEAVEHHRAGRFEEAERLYRDVLVHEPRNGDALHLLGVLVGQRGELEASLDLISRAIAIRESADCYSNLGNILAFRGNLTEAVAVYRRALRLNADHPDAHHNLSLALLLQGDFARGWAEFEWRWKKHPEWDRGFPQPPWQGEDPAGRTILLHAEQGLGDTLQFVRYAPLVAERGARVLLEVQPELVRLLGDLPGVERLIARHAPLPDFDLHCPLLSLPRLFGTELGTIPAPVGYLRAEPERIARWRDLLPKDGLRIGIVWQGNPANGADRGRSIPLSALAPLARVPGVHLVAEAGAASSGPGSHGLSFVLPGNCPALGTAFLRQGRLDDALTAYRAAADHCPADPEAHFNLATALLMQGQLEDAIAAYRKASELRPDYLEASCNLAAALLERDRPAEVVEECRRALALNPSKPELHLNLGSALVRLGRIEDAAASYRAAIERRADYPEAHVGLGLVLLQQGDFEKGWAEYEWRLQREPKRKWGQARPIWPGTDPAGRTILLHSEQGLGDTLQFVRYAPLLAERGATVLLEAPKPLLRLLGAVPGVARVIARGEPLPEFDVHCPLPSLAKLLRMSVTWGSFNSVSTRKRS